MKESKINMLTTQYDNFTMKEGETIHDMHTKFSFITDELQSLGEPISNSKKGTKEIRVLPKSWESKVEPITKAKDLKLLTMDALIENLKTREIKTKIKISLRRKPKRISLFLKISSSEVSSEED